MLISIINCRKDEKVAFERKCVDDKSFAGEGFLLYYYKICNKRAITGGEKRTMADKSRSSN
jgi:hypothetical protein